VDVAKSYPIIGGPLDGQHANYKDFDGPVYSFKRDPNGEHMRDKIIKPAGIFHAEQDAYNGASRLRGVPSMVFLWRKLLP
jgi:hypothetical protein